MLRRLLLPLVLLAVCAPPASSVTIQAGRPRLFFEADSLPAIRARLGVVSPGPSYTEDTGAPNHKCLDKLQLVNAAAFGTNNSSQRILFGKAYYFWVTGDTLGRDALTDYLANNAASFYAIPWNSDAFPGFPPVTAALDITWDWMEPWKQAAVKARLDVANNIANPASGISQSPNLRTLGNIMVLSGVAGLTFNPQTGADFTADWFEDVVVPTWQETSTNGASDGYIGKYCNSFFTWLNAFDISGDLHLVAGNSSLEGMGPFWNRVTRTLATSVDGNDRDVVPHRARQVMAKQNPTGMDPTAVLAFSAGRMGNVEAQARLKRFYDNTTAANLSALQAIFISGWADMSWDPIDAEDIDPHWVDLGRSWYIGWDDPEFNAAGNPATDGGDVWLFLGCHPGTEEQRSVRQLQLMRNDDDLIPCHSVYVSDADLVHLFWVDHPWANSTISVYDPSETFGTEVAFGDTIAVPNGGQQNGSNDARADAKWPHASTPPYGSDSPFTFLGEITDCFAYGDTAVGIFMDLDDAFVDTKCTAWDSTVRWYPTHGFIVVRDRLVLGANPDLEVWSSVSSEFAPVPDATPATVEGEWGVGGVFTAANVGIAHPWKQDSKDSRLWITPIDGTATAGTPVLVHEIVGGAVRVAGTPTYWAQDLAATAAGYNASLHSWEFCIGAGGKNYPPNTTPGNRHSYTSSPWQITADYRSALKVTGAASLSTVDIAYVMETTTSTGDPAAHEVVASTTGNVKAVGMHNGASWLVDVGPAPGASWSGTYAWTSPLDAGDTGSFQVAWNLAPSEDWIVYRNGAQVATTTSDGNGTAFFSPSGAGDGSMTMELDEGDGDDGPGDAGGRGGRRGTRRVQR